MLDARTEDAALIQTTKVIWLTGVSGVGKTTIAGALRDKLRLLGKNAVILDGDILRSGLNCDLSFSPKDRSESSRRTSYLAELLAIQGHWIIVSLISPYRKDRDFARQLLRHTDFIEVYLHAPLSILSERDPKGLYRKVEAGSLRDFTGVDAPYEAPVSPELKFDTSTVNLENIILALLNFIHERSVEVFNVQPSTTEYARRKK